MKEKCIIKVVGIQEDAEGTENKIELVTEGTCYKKNKNFYIVYEESEISGMEGSTTTLKIEDGSKISMRRFGNLDIHLVFEKGKSYNSQYRTQYGDFDMEVFTKELDIMLCNKTQQGKIAIEYDLWVAGIADSANELNIQLM